MKHVVDLVGQPLAWTQPTALKMNYELRVGTDLAATLIFRNLLGSFATGRSGDGCWTFKRVGFWSTRATIRECDGEAELGSFKNNTWKGGGSLLLADGRRFPATTNVWKSNLEFQTDEGAPLIRFKGGGVLHHSATVELLPQAVDVPEMRWIVILGWYLTVMMRMDTIGDAAGAAAAAS